MTPYERHLHKQLNRMQEERDDAAEARDRYLDLYDQVATERDCLADQLAESRRAHETTLLALTDAVKEIRELNFEIEWQRDKASDLIRATTKPFFPIEVIHGEPKL